MMYPGKTLRRRGVAWSIILVVLVILPVRQLPAGPPGGARLDPSSSVHGQLLRKAAKNSSVRVIVGLNVAFAPEGNVRDRLEIERQRQSIGAAQRALLNLPGLRNARDVKLFAQIPFLALRADAVALQTLLANQGVTSLHEDKLVDLALADSVPMIGANAAYAAGFTGAGQTIAVLDSGVDKTHPFLAGKVVSEACYSTTDASEGATSLCPGGVSASTASDSGRNCQGSIPGCDHGTHVAGIAVGKGLSFSGVAKDASLIAIQVFSKFTSGGSHLSAFDSDIVLGLERVYDLRGTYTIAAVNMSLGGGRYSTPDRCDAGNAATKAAIDNLRSVGIPTVIAASNTSFVDSLASPGCISSAISVGSTTKSDTISSFSNSATFLHLLAPGGNINSSVPGGGFALKSGTSMAAPHVAGAWAILKQQAPSASVAQLLAALQTTGKSVIDARNGLVKPRIQIDAARTPASRLTSACDNYEPDGNEASSARPFGVGTVELHAFCPADDVDWFTFTVPTNAGARYEIETFDLASGLDTVLSLYGPNSSTSPVATNDNVGGSNLASFISHDLTTPGVYYVKANGKGAGGGGQTYNLRIKRVAYLAAACNLDEPNDTFETSVVIAVNTTKSYAFCEAPDVDTVQFAAAANTRYLVEAVDVSPAVNVVIDIFSFDGANFTCVGTVNSRFKGGAESATVTGGTSDSTIVLQYYDFSESYGPSNTYSVRVGEVPSNQLTSTPTNMALSRTAMQQSTPTNTAISCAPTQIPTVTTTQTQTSTTVAFGTATPTNTAQGVASPTISATAAPTSTETPTIISSATPTMKSQVLPTATATASPVMRVQRQLFLPIVRR